MTYRTGALRTATNGWDKNDPHGIYFSGTAASNTTISGASGTFTTGRTMTPNAYRRDAGAERSRRHRLVIFTRLYISDNTATTITYYYGGAGPGCPACVQWRRRIFYPQGADRAGSEWTWQRRSDHFFKQDPGIGLISNRRLVFRGTTRIPTQVRCYGINNSIPTQHEGSDYMNLGAGLPANQIPAQVTAAYPASVNGGSAYNHEYTYPHPLVTGGPSPTPTPTSSPTATATATPTATLQPYGQRRHRPQRQH